MVRNLPEVESKDLLLWDDEHAVCGGFLNKKASQSSTFSKGKWQRRWFSINLDVRESKDNYTFEYFHSPDEKQPSKTYPLAGATIKISGDTSFVIAFHDGSSLSLGAENSELLRCWTSTLDSVIIVSNMRERLMDKYDSASGGSQDGEDEADNELGELDGTANRLKGRRRGSDHHRARRVHIQQKTWPMVRIDLDIASIPPGSNERFEFISGFCKDIAHALSIDPDFVEVISIRPAPGVDWLSLVEFDINLWSADFDDNQSTGNSSAANNSISERRRAVRKDLLLNLQELVADSSSSLYHGLVTSRLDASFATQVVDLSTLRKPRAHGEDDNDDVDDDDEFTLLQQQREHDVDVFSSSPEIMQLMQRYKDVQVPESFEDKSLMQITLYFEGRIATVHVPNPALLTKRYCALWPFEVKAALGFLGTMQELWIEPIELIPRDSTMKSQTKSIVFSPSVRLHGEKVINAVHLHANGHYDVKCTDQRDEALNSLSKEEMDEIKDIFQQCDIDGDGGISKDEMESIVRTRTQERKAVVEKKFKKYVAEGGNDLSAEDLAAAQWNKSKYIQQLQEAQARLLTMFESADLNGDGVISFTEFILAEAWWMRCTINPSRAHLF